MDNLYNKIYKAVNEGIQKALLINPEQNDVSINYIYHKIDNEINIQLIFNDAANEFIKNPDMENYNKILLYSQNGKYQYKIKDFNQLINIFDKTRRVTKNVNLSWVDTENCLTFITENGEELSLNKINNDNIVFVKFDNNELKHPVIIHQKLLISNNKLNWCIQDEVNNTIYTNTKNGYAVTENIKNNINNLNYYPAFEYCVNIKKQQPKLNLLDYTAYLPAINELHFLYDYKKFMDYIFMTVFNKRLGIDFYSFWSSTDGSAYTLPRQSAYITEIGIVTEKDKNQLYYVLPFFHKN